MKNFVTVGMAGHVDHGKSQLCRALCGMETDRLKEEKARGMTIELAFAPLALPSGLRAALVDVPGHERFVKTMLAGACGVDIALLLIDAREGVMPQTREHLDILRLLQVKNVITVLSKCDLLDDVSLREAEEKARAFLQTTPFAEAPLLAVSAKTGLGLPALLAAIDALAAALPEREALGAARLPIDRVFSLSGSGTIVTGALWSGVLSCGGDWELLGDKGVRKVRIRSLQVHGEKAERALAGQRVAAALPGVAKDSLRRGFCLCSPGLLRPGQLFEVSLTVLPQAAPLSNRQRVQVFHAASHVPGEVRFSSQAADNGEPVAARLYTEKPLFALAGDRFVLRAFSPARTVAGGVILGPAPEGGKRRSAQSSRLLGLDLRTAEEAALAAGLDLACAAEELRLLEERGEALGLTEKGAEYYFPAEWPPRAVEMIAQHHREHPLSPGLPMEELKNRLFPQLTRQRYQLLLRHWRDEGRLRLTEARLSLPGFTPAPDARQRESAAKIEAFLARSGLEPVAWPRLLQELGLRPGEAAELLPWLTQRVMLRLSGGLVAGRAAQEQAWEKMAAHLARNGSVTVGAARDLLGVSRRVALLYLEFWEENRLLLRRGDERVLWPAEQKP
ncbi:MAG: selenocysteine-specific translation elongation factor [Clostridiales bacterium]|nr:selenocysteine-specific translation elongation factor [Clostridiales bacterium]